MRTPRVPELVLSESANAPPPKTQVVEDVDAEVPEAISSRSARPAVTVAAVPTPMVTSLSMPACV